MNLLSKSDSEIAAIAEPLYREHIKACNTKDWVVLSHYMPQELATEERKKDVEAQWENVPLLTSLSDKKEFLGVLRRGDCVHTLWKQWSIIDDIEYLGVMILIEQKAQLKVTGFFIN